MPTTIYSPVKKANNLPMRLSLYLINSFHIIQGKYTPVIMASTEPIYTNAHELFQEIFVVKRPVETKKTNKLHTMHRINDLKN